MSNPTPETVDGFVVAGQPLEEETQLRAILRLSPGERQAALSEYLQSAKREATESSGNQVRALLDP